MAPTNVVKLPAKTHQAALRRFARDAAEDDCEVVLEFQGDIDPAKIVKFVEWAGEEYSLNLVITHAELKDYVAMAASGAAIGAGLALAAKALGMAVGWPVVAAAAVGGAILGALSTGLHVKIWKYKGKNRMKLAPVA